MRRLHNSVVQLEESKRFILSGSIPHLRLALILLDNAIEVMMHRVLEDDLRHANAYLRMSESFPPGPLDEKGEQLRDEIRSQSVSVKRQRAIRRYFGEKLKYLSEDRDRMPKAVARALRHLHNYRNEAHHHDEVRDESIRPATLLLFDIATDLLVRLPPGVTFWASDDDLTWLERYAVAPPYSNHEDIRAHIADRLRQDLPLDVEGIRDALVTHLAGRLEAARNQLDFVVGNAAIGSDRPRVLKAIQFWEVYPAVDPRKSREFARFKPRYTVESFSRWDREVAHLKMIEDRIELFEQFAVVEDDFEPLERMIDEWVNVIDNAIQMELDRIRGK